MRWHDILKPHRSMLKFRLSWQPGMTEYLDGFFCLCFSIYDICVSIISIILMELGNLHLPIWGPVTTTESRLITHPGFFIYFIIIRMRCFRIIYYSTNIMIIMICRSSRERDRHPVTK